MGVDRLIHSLASSFQTFREKLLTGLLWNGLSSVSLQGANLLASALLARLLGLEVFGAYALLIATVTMVANFAQGGCGFVATKLVSENLGVSSTGVLSALRLCALLTSATGVMATLLLLVFAPEFSVHVLRRPELQYEVRIVAVSILFQVVVTYQTGALQGFSAFKEISKASAFAGAANLVCLVVGALWADLVGALTGFTLATAFRMLFCGLGLQRVRRRHGLSGSVPIRSEDVKHVWQIALPAGLAGLVTMPALWLVNLGLSALPQGLSLVGIFSVAMQIRQVALQVPILLNSVTFAAMGQAKGMGVLTEFRKLFLTNLSVNLILGCVVSLFIILTADEILFLWHITSAEAVSVTRILAASIIPELLAMSAYQLVQSSGRMWASLLQIAIPRDAAYFGMATWLMPSHGLTAAASAYFVAQLIGLSATLMTVWKLRIKLSQNVNAANT